MSQKTICDGCGNDAPETILKKGDDGIDRCAPLGKQGDGVHRSLEFRYANHIIKMDLCVSCHERARSTIADIFPYMALTRDQWWNKMGYPFKD
jgi:hypothetical protein